MLTREHAMFRTLLIGFAACALAVLLAGCGSATGSGRSTALTGFDLEAMAAKMADSIVADPEVQAVVRQAGPLKVVIRPVENQLTGEVLPRGQAEAFTAQVRTLLARARTGNFTWVNNRDDFYAMRARELEGIDLGPAPEAVNPEYALTATFRSLTEDDKRRRRAFYQCVFRLTDLDDRTVLWTDVYNVSRRTSKNLLD